MTLTRQTHTPGLLKAFCFAVATLAGAVLGLNVGLVQAQTTSLVLANPNWNITLTDYGYSDFLLDNTPGFEGREYLSGEWGAAVAYTADTTPVTPTWLEPRWVFPDWITNSNFHVVSPITPVGVNASALPITRSVIANDHLEITLVYEMLDTVTGTPMGVTPASATGPGKALPSNRYILKQTSTFKNISGAAISNLQFFQFLHGLSSQRGVCDNRQYSGQFGEFRYDATLSGMDPQTKGLPTVGTGLEDYLCFHASAAPDAFEIGYFGIEGNGIDFHGLGKPSVGVHLSVEDNWQSVPYAALKSIDRFEPEHRWVAGAQRWTLGNLAIDESVSRDILLTILTGTKVIPGSGTSGSCNGGSTVPGGIDYQFTDTAAQGACFGRFSRAADSELQIRIDRGEFSAFTFPTPGKPSQIWGFEFDGTNTGEVRLTFGYDSSLLPIDFAEETLALYHFDGNDWQKLPGVVDTAAHRIAVSTTTFGSFMLGIEGSGSSVDIAATVSPPNSGTITGAGFSAVDASVTLVATAASDYVFANWTENGDSVSASPTYTFTAITDRTLVANFIAVGDNESITTTSLPSNGGTTSGCGAYALNSTATVNAVAAPGFKFSKWLSNGVAVSTAKTYTFTVTEDRVLVAVFVRGYRITTSAEPSSAGTVSGAGIYDAGNPVNLTATSKPGHLFLNWSEAGAIVGEDPFFSFISSGNRTLVANFTIVPVISITSPEPGKLVLSWPADATDWILEESASLSAGTWAQSPRTISIVGSENQVMIDNPSGSSFFRLARPN